MLFQAICYKINEQFFEQENDIIQQSVESRYNEKKDKACKFPDLELGFGPIIEAEPNINDKLSSQSFLDNCLSSINYLTSPDRIKLDMSFSFMFEQEKVSKQKKDSKQEQEQDSKQEQDKEKNVTLADSYIIDIY
jgi:hypothetical protein